MVNVWNIMRPTEISSEEIIYQEKSICIVERFLDYFPINLYLRTLIIKRIKEYHSRFIQVVGDGKVLGVTQRWREHGQMIIFFKYDPVDGIL